MPYIAGGAENQTIMLRELVKQVLGTDGSNDLDIYLEDKKHPRKLKQVLRYLGGSGLFVATGSDSNQPSSELISWFETKKPEILFWLLHRNIRFFGECLYELADHPIEIGELLEIANSSYDTNWSTYDQVRRRLSWLRSLGYVEYKTAKLIGVTESGRKALNSIEIGSPEYEEKDNNDFDFEGFLTQYPLLKQELDNLTSSRLAERNSIIGYIPAGANDNLSESFNEFVSSISEGISRSELVEKITDKFNISESSFSAAFTTFSKLDLIKETGYYKYSLSALAEEWKIESNSLALVLLIHCKIRGVLETIPILEEFSKGADVARELKRKYALPRVDVAGTRKILHLLQIAGLIEERSNWRYLPTPLGRLIASLVPLEEEKGVEQIDSSEKFLHETKKNDNPVDEIDLLQAGIASDSPGKLEKAVADAFAFLGFNTNLIGGSGNTDVFATLEVAPGSFARIVIDAKSSKSGNVNEGSIQFDTLEEHRVKNKADYIVVVGPGFENGRIKKRAANNNVRLITTEELLSVMKKQYAHPISSNNFIDLIRPDKNAMNNLENKWLQQNQRAEIISKVVDALREEKLESDEVTGGSLTTKEIYLMMRGSAETKITLADIDFALDLLAHPFIGAVRKDSQKYTLVDSPKLIKEKVKGIINLIDESE